MEIIVWEFIVGLVVIKLFIWFKIFIVCFCEVLGGSVIVFIMVLVFLLGIIFVGVIFIKNINKMIEVVISLNDNYFLWIKNIICFLYFFNIEL